MYEELLQLKPSSCQPDTSTSARLAGSAGRVPRFCLRYIASQNVETSS